jgi:hypothetical protein
LAIAHESALVSLTITRTFSGPWAWAGKANHKGTKTPRQMEKTGTGSCEKIDGAAFPAAC